ncbi:MAG: hypothetical protein HZA21_03530, partial [Nitrospirae bacterium]|nr:hypothetical protein [Nitrospirota bacterium]
MRSDERRKQHDERKIVKPLVAGLALLISWLTGPAMFDAQHLAVNAEPQTSGSESPHSSFSIHRSALPGERHLANIQQLTFGNKNAEAYFSFSGNMLVFQSTNDWRDSAQATSKTDGGKGLGCYQMYVMDLESDSTGLITGGVIRLVSTGVGSTTCGYFFPGDRRVLYSSTHLVAPHCPPKPKMEG